MKCMQCEEEARAVCQFCGDGVCRTHRSEGRFVSGGKAMGQAGWGHIPKTESDKMVVPKAAWCGRCFVET